MEDYEKICSDLAKMINAFGDSWTNEKITAEDLIKLFVSNEQARLIIKKGKKACLIEPYDNSFHKLSDNMKFIDPSDHIPGWTEESEKQKHT